MHGVIIQSGNDAAIALAEHISGGETAFADNMNFQAEQLGMTNTYYANSTGLPASRQTRWIGIIGIGHT